LPPLSVVIDCVRRHGSKADAVEPSLLAGMLTDRHGGRFTPSRTVKNGRRYRYYVSAAPTNEAGTDRAQGWRLPAQEIEPVMISILVEALTNPIFRAPSPGAPEMPNRSSNVGVVRALVQKVVVDEKTIIVKVRPDAQLNRDIPSPASEDLSGSTIELRRRSRSSGAASRPGWCCLGWRSKTTPRDAIRR
jgi:hypothetical protein